MCNIHKEDLKSQSYEIEGILRNQEQYNLQLAKNNFSKTGIKEKCVWLSLRGFRLFDQVGVNVMHDVLEGVAKYVMSFLLSKYVLNLK